jgi:tetratricopeptide (TPR) repeat protein
VIRVIYNLGSSFCFSLALVALCSAALQGADTAEAAFQQAASALSSQDYAAAEKGFQDVLRIEPGNISALGNLGVVYSKTHRYSRAIEVYQRALRLAPGEKGLLTNLGLAYLKQEQYQAAASVFEKLAADPSNLQARELLATCDVSLARHEAALAVLEPLDRAEPKNPGVLYLLGITLTRLKRAPEAHDAFARMMSAASPAQADFLMGKASYETERFPEAAEFFRKALAADPSLEGIHRELGKALISLRDNENAEKELRLAGPEDPEALYFLGGMLALSRPADAIAPLNKAREMNPDFWGPLYYLGRIYVDQGRPKEALPFLEHAARLKPDEAAVQYQLGRAFKRAGREGEAKAAFARVAELKSRSLDREVNLLSPGSKR